MAAGFYYFLPNASSVVTAEQNGGPNSGKLCFDAFPPHLADLFVDYADVPNQVIVAKTPGPNGINGHLLIPQREIDGQKPPTVIFEESKQTWESRDNESYWIGYLKDDPPHPSWCQKRGAITSWTIDELWKIGVYSSPDGQRLDLPSAYSFPDNGPPQIHVAKQYDHYWQLAGRALDHLTGEQPLSEIECIELAVELLKLNYRLGTPELDVMYKAGFEWLKSHVVQIILMTVCDWEKVAEQLTVTQDEEKKSLAPGSENVTPGALAAAG